MATFLQRVGSEILVNTTTLGDQNAQQITALDGGGFVVTWRDDSATGGDTSGSSVRAQVFAAGGATVGSEILVNTTTNSNQFEQQITALSGGGFVVTWRDESQTGGDTSGPAVRAQVFAAGGGTVGGEILVNTTTLNSQDTPQITALDGGGFVVTWQDGSGENGDISGQSVRAQVFAAGGGTVGSEILVNTETTGSQDIPQITALDGGGFVVTWRDFSGLNGDTSGSSVRAQVFAAGGGTVGSEILVNTTTTNNQQGQQITALDGGGFVVTWQDGSGENGDISGQSVRAQVFAAGGGTVGSEILVNTTTLNSQDTPQITALDGGGFVVTWQDDSGLNGDSVSLSVRAQVFAAGGGTVGGEILVNTTTFSSELYPQITALAGGGFVVTWEHHGGYDGSGASVHAQVFAADGDKAGGEILVNTTTDGNQLASQITALDGGGFVVTWQDNSGLNGDPSGTSVRAQVFGFNVTGTIDDGGGMLASAAATLFDVIANDTPSDLGIVTVDTKDVPATDVPGIDAADLTVVVVNNKISVDLGADFNKLDAGEQATVVIGYTVTDPFGNAEQGTLTVTVDGVNDAPQVPDQVDAVLEGGSITGNALAGVFDADEDPFSVASVQGNASQVGQNIAGIYGTLILHASGAYTYAADHADKLSTGEIEHDIFNFTVSDGRGGVTGKTLDIAVTGRDNIIVGTAGNDVLNGTGGRDIIIGDLGNDTIDGKGGADIMLGGAGNDIYTVDNAADAAIEFGGEGTDRIRSTVSFALSEEVENLTLLNGIFAFDGTGNSTANAIVGNDTANTLDGGGGIDTLKGGKGDDIYRVDVAGDIVTELAGAGTGTDTVESTAANYTLSVNVERLTLVEGAGNLNGTGNAGDNILTGNTQVNTLNGGDGKDTLDGGGGGDTLAGGAGGDLYFINNTGVTIIELLAGGGVDTVNSTVDISLGAAAIENLILLGAAVNGIGSNSGNAILGNTLDNTLDGLGGSDILTGGAGNDTMTGGDGNDFFNVDQAGDVVNEGAGLGSGIDEVRSTISRALEVNVENLTLTGFNNINGTGNAAANTITGNDGENILDGGGLNDRLIGKGGNDTYIVDNIGDVVVETGNNGIDLVKSSVNHTLSVNVDNLTLTGGSAINGIGNALNNFLTGNGANNTLNGNAGNDTLDGNGGLDTLQGGAGNDIYFVDSANDVIFEAVSMGTDLVFSTSASYQLALNVENLTLLTGASDGTGNVGNNVLTGNGVANTLTGGDGLDTLDGQGGVDTLIGGKGDDKYYVDEATDNVLETAGQGTDTVYSSSEFILSPNVENLFLTGNGNIDAVGNSAANVIVGNTGDNKINGDAGNDVLSGGGGIDEFRFNVIGAGKDVITDFVAGVDHIQVAGLFADFTAVSAAMTDSATGVKITSGSDTLTLFGVHIDQLDGSDFLFV